MEPDQDPVQVRDVPGYSVRNEGFMELLYMPDGWSDKSGTWCQTEL